MASLKLESLSNSQYRNCGWGTVSFPILPNIPGQRYTIGSTYPGQRPKEEFIFLQNDNLIDSIHCHITVDDKSQYWISKATPTAIIFVNKELIRNAQILQIADIVSLGGQNPSDFGTKEQPLFFFALTKSEEKPFSLVNKENVGNTFGVTPCSTAVENPLILVKIFGHLSVKDISICQRVCKLWNAESRIILEKKGKLSFTFDDKKYQQPIDSMRIFRYLFYHKNLTIQNLHIQIALTEDPKIESDIDYGDNWNPIKSGSPGQKMIDDIYKLLNSDNNFTSLHIKQIICTKTDFILFRNIISILQEKLEELHLKVDVNFQSANSLPLTLPCLKRFKHSNYTELNDDRPFNPNWFSLTAVNMEAFSCIKPYVGFYLQEFAKTNTLKLSEFKCPDGIHLEDVSLLSQSRFPLTILNLEGISVSNDISAVQELLEVYSSNLTVLTVDVFSKTIASLKLPAFPNLKKLSFRYGHKLRITQGTIIYEKLFPSLCNLEVTPSNREFGMDEYDLLQSCWLTNLLDEERVFNSFFPAENDQILKKVKVLFLPFVFISDDMFKERLSKVVEMFPNATIKRQE